ncbi:MAG: hypothetical protein R3F55_18645 [Alphaproteobacteria bacterium]
MTILITAAADRKQGPGHAVIRVEGVRVAPDDIRFAVRRPGFREDSLGPTGWQAAEALLTPAAAYVVQDALFLHVGSEVVAHMEPGMNVAFLLVLPDGAALDGRLAWPAIPGPIGGAGARRGRMVATRRVEAEAPALRTGAALVGDTPPPPAAPQPPASSKPVAAVVPPAPEPVSPPPVQAAVEPEEPVADPAFEAEPESGGRPAPDLRAERDAAATAAAAAHRRPWGRRVAAVASISVVLIAGAAAASVYLGRDEICAHASLGAIADDLGLCPPVVVAEAAPPEPQPADPATAPDPSRWNINPLSWLGPQETPRGGAAAPADATDDQAAQEPPPSPESQRELARQYLESQPSPEEAFGRASELLAQGQVDAAFLIFRYAAERGYADAATAVAAMYDPETFTPQTSPLPRPNPSVARSWYERAVAAGDEEALLSLARLLADENAIEDAREALHRAEEAGLVDAARQMLEDLQ